MPMNVVPRSGREGYDVFVVGAGAAGIIAAWRAASLGARTLLLEKTPRLGTKILISGGGKCNITHDGPLEELLRAFRSNEARFLRPACYRFDNRRVVEMLTSRGLEVYTRPDGRIFPVNQTAKDVVAILGGYLAEVGVEVRLQSPVTGVLTDQGAVSEIQLKGGTRLPCEHLVVAVGGSSYPASGTTGDGFAWARRLGHTVAPILAALAPMELGDALPSLAGVALRDCLLKARKEGREVARWRDDLLFTHRGVSGPAVLGISRDVAEAGEATLEVDILPGAPFETVRESWARRVAESPRRKVATVLEQDVPAAIVPLLLKSAGVAPDTTLANFPQRHRNRLIETMKGWGLGAVRDVVLDKGEVVAGGISLDEVDPQTMRSKIVEGLYLCGEVLDVAGPVGGYNLQAAFATGFVAGETAAKDALGA